jgi:hypothetical protein
VNIHSISKQLLALQQELNDRHFTRALSLARTRPLSDFAAVLWETSPHPGPRLVSVDLDLLSDAELHLVSQWKP